MKDFTLQLILDIVELGALGISTIYMFLAPSVSTLELLAIVNYVVNIGVVLFWLHRTREQDKNA